VVGPIIIAAGAFVVGNTLGLVAGYYGGTVDSVIMRIVDLVWALPALLITIVIVGVGGAGYYVAVAVLLLFTVPGDARIIRGATLEQRTRPYVEAARTLGLSRLRIMTRHVWPNVIPLATANAFLNFAYSLVALSALAFLGLGVPIDTPDWGGMLAQNRPLLQQSPAAVLAPAIAIALTATAMNLMGDWMYEVLSDRGRAR
jgi:peptide/nickel transport system permease protein